MLKQRLHNQDYEDLSGSGFIWMGFKYIAPSGKLDMDADSVVSIDF